MKPKNSTDSSSSKGCNKIYKLTIAQKIYMPIKRFFDIVVSLASIVVLSPLLIISAILIKTTSRGPIIFSQERVGQYSKTINIYKFRTMVEASPKNVPTYNLPSPQSYITKVGKFLRLTSIDEIPQLFNVLKGEMSIIGPRPLIPDETLAHKLRESSGVYLIKPGITGFAQVNGRDCLNIEKKVEFDTAYLHSVSPWLDLCIILKSIVVVFSHADFLEGKKEK